MTQTMDTDAQAAVLSDIDRSVAIVRHSRQTHVDWLACQEDTPGWRQHISRYTQAGGPRTIDSIEEPACKILGSDRMSLNKCALDGLIRMQQFR